MLLKLSSHLLKDGRPFKENAVAIIDSLLNSIRYFTISAKESKDERRDKKIWFPKLIMIKKAFDCL